MREQLHLIITSAKCRLFGWGLNLSTTNERTQKGTLFVDTYECIYIKSELLAKNLWLTFYNLISNHQLELSIFVADGLEQEGMTRYVCLALTHRCVTVSTSRSIHSVIVQSDLSSRIDYSFQLHVSFEGSYCHLIWTTPSNVMETITVLILSIRYFWLPSGFSHWNINVIDWRISRIKPAISCIFMGWIFNPHLIKVYANIIHQFPFVYLVFFSYFEIIQSSNEQYSDYRIRRDRMPTTEKALEFHIYTIL